MGNCPCPLYTATPGGLTTAAHREGRILWPSQSQPWARHTTKGRAPCCSSLYLNVTCIIIRLQPPAVPRTSPRHQNLGVGLVSTGPLQPSLYSVPSYFPFLATVKRREALIPAMTQINLKNFMVSERRQKQKATSCRIALTGKVQNMQIHSHGKQTCGYHGLKGGRSREWLLRGVKIFWNSWW